MVIQEELINNLRAQGLNNEMIFRELKNEGYSDNDIAMALSKDEPTLNDQYYPEEEQQPEPQMQQPKTEDQSNIYERIEDITESLIDEKWEELISEVKKIIQWKNSIEDKQKKVEADLQKIKEDFNLLHQGVLGKLEDYNDNVGDLNSEMKAVGKVFREIIPQFVDTVKELKDIKDQIKN